VCYDISDPAAPRFAGRVWLGGVIAAGGGVEGDAEALEALGLAGGAAPPRPVVKGVTVQVRMQARRVERRLGDAGRAHDASLDCAPCRPSLLTLAAPRPSPMPP
jgi:hypothetical protein